jgi:Ca-activated chloride channel family protein
MLNSRSFYNSRPDGYAVLEVIPDESNGPRRFVPLKRTDLAGNVTGPLANLTLTQTFSFTEPADAVIEALYRFPLPGDAAVTGVRVRFGNVEINTVLKERETAEEEYKEAKRSGRQAALVTRESPDVFTLAIAGIHAGEDIVVRTEYIQLAKPEGKGWSLRVPLTTSPRYVRSDESNSRHAEGQPLAIMRDPGHRFSLTLTCSDADRIASNTHALMVSDGQIRLRDGEVLPDRDCIIIWQPKTDSRPALSVWSQSDSTAGNAYFVSRQRIPKSRKCRAR